MKKISIKGFTLIELLIVVAIIGILASVILPNLNTARSKGTVSAFKAEMDSFRKQAEDFFSNGNTYDGLFTTDATPVVDSVADASIQSIVTSLIESATNATVYGGNNGNEYVLYARLPQIIDPNSLLAADIWCVDSTGKVGNPSVDAVDQFDPGVVVTACW